MIQLPTRISARGQKYLKTLLIRPCVCRNRSIPTRIRAPPQKMLSRFILTSISAPIPHKPSGQEINTQQDKNDRGAIFTQDGNAAEECCKDQEHHCTDDDEVQTVSKVPACIFAQKPGQDGTNSHKTRDQRPHVGPRPILSSLVLVIQNATDASDDGGRNGHPRRAGEQANDEHEQPGTDRPHGPSKVIIQPFLYGRNLSGDHEPAPDQYQQNAKKEIGTVLSHEILLFKTTFVQTGSISLYEKNKPGFHGAGVGVGVIA